MSTLTEYYSRDPAELTEQEVSKIVEELRGQYANYIKLGHKTPAAAKREKKKTEQFSLQQSIDLGDL